MATGDPIAQLNQAIELYNAGNVTEARYLLQRLTAQTPTMEKAWLWLAAVSEDTGEKIRSLEKVLQLNPANERARNALSRLTGSAPTPPPISQPLRSMSEIPPPIAPSGTNTVILVILACVAATIMIAVIAVLLTNPRVQTILRGTPTPTPTFTPSLTSTLRFTLTPTITPGGPTFTPIVPPTLPPTWTPAPTQTSEPTFTPLPTETTAPSATPFILPTVTRILSPTPGPTAVLETIPTLPPVIPTNDPSNIPPTPLPLSATPPATPGS
jgi:hypothetical protein